MFWCDVCHHVQGVTYQVKEYLKPHKLALRGQMWLGKNVVLITVIAIEFLRTK